MSPSTADSQIRARIDQFVSELSGVIRETAFEAVREALGDGAAPRPVRRGKNAGRRAASSGADVSGAVLAHVRSNPGSRAEQITAALGANGDAVKKALARLKNDGAIKARGVKRGTNYVAVGGGGSRTASSK